MYQPPYDIYNLDAAPLDELRAGFLDPINGYYAISDEDGRLIAFCCFGPDARVPGGDYALPALDVGIGLRPDLTGRGLGPSVIGAAIDFADAALQARLSRTTIAAVNRRSLRAFEKASFSEVGRFAGGSGGEQRDWIIMLSNDT